jgi:hypothetical protein
VAWLWNDLDPQEGKPEKVPRVYAMSLGGVQHHFYTGHGGDPAHHVLAAIAGLEIDWRDTEDDDEDEGEDG